MGEANKKAVLNEWVQTAFGSENLQQFSGKVTGCHQDNHENKSDHTD